MQEITELLERLGLTEYEAKTLTTLFKLRETEAPEISRIAQVPKTRVYDVLDRLTKKGLVIEIYGRPKKFRVTDPNNALESLIRRKKEEIKELEKRSSEIRDVIGTVQKAEEESGEKVMKVKDKQDFLRILEQEIGKAKNEVLAFTKLEDNHLALREALNDALKRKVDVKVVSKIPSNYSETAKKLSNQGIDLREIDHGINAYVIDKKRVVLGISDFSKQKPEYHFTIWNNNKGIANAFQKYFDHCWKEGK